MLLHLIPLHYTKKRQSNDIKMYLALGHAYVTYSTNETTQMEYSFIAYKHAFSEEMHKIHLFNHQCYRKMHVLLLDKNSYYIGHVFGRLAVFAATVTTARWLFNNSALYNGDFVK